MNNPEAVDLANSHISEFTYQQVLFQAKRSDGCGCGNCFADFEDALDRQDWDLQEGRWTWAREVPKSPKPKTYTKRRQEDDDWGEEEYQT